MYMCSCRNTDQNRNSSLALLLYNGLRVFILIGIRKAIFNTFQVGLAYQVLIELPESILAVLIKLHIYIDWVSYGT